VISTPSAISLTRRSESRAIASNTCACLVVNVHRLPGTAPNRCRFLASTAELLVIPQSPDVHLQPLLPSLLNPRSAEGERAGGPPRVCVHARRSSVVFRPASTPRGYAVARTTTSGRRVRRPLPRTSTAVTGRACERPIEPLSSPCAPAEPLVLGLNGYGSLLTIANRRMANLADLRELPANSAYYWRCAWRDSNPRPTA
jgi:hypothetical protein